VPIVQTIRWSPLIGPHICNENSPQSAKARRKADIRFPR
jgi:hypothetical protein